MDGAALALAATSFIVDKDHPAGQFHIDEAQRKDFGITEEFEIDDLTES